MTQLSTQTPERVSETTSFQSVTTSASSVDQTYLLKPAKDWDWRDLRDYIVAEGEKRFGTQRRNPAKESGIAKAFLDRHGNANAVLVAIAAFEIYGGLWMKAPIRIERFSKNCDPTFADVILSRVAS